MTKDILGDRMKSYENAYRYYIPNKMPVVIRLDGKGWHNYTKGCKKPFDENLMHYLDETAIYLCNNIQGVKLAYTQSDEISLLIYNDDFDAQGWFDNNLQKTVSVSASMAGAYYTSVSDKVFGKTKLALFDSRVFILPEDEVVNYFIFRQQDATRNSVQMLARSLYSHTQLNLKKNAELKRMCADRGEAWEDLAPRYQRGRCVRKITEKSVVQNKKTQQFIEVDRRKWIIDSNIPIFSNDRDYIEKELCGFSNI